MITVYNCPICDSPHIKAVKKHVFTFPGQKVEDHLIDATYTRLWILFQKILQNTKEATFSSTLCHTCGFIFTNPRFSEQELNIKYDTINELGSVKYRTKVNPPLNLDKRAARIYSLIDGVFNHSQQPQRRTQLSANKPKILDYGGASGYNLIPFVDSFKCYVIDHEKWNLPQGIEYLGRHIIDANHDPKFAVILLLHTLEHITRPKEFLANLCRYLSDDGIVYVEVPLGCFREWATIKNPLTHVNFFSEESLYKCLELCGLNIISISTAYQWVTHGKMWCLNVIGARKEYRGSDRVMSVLSTRRQMSKCNYYLAYLLDRRVMRKVLKKLTGV